MQSTKRQEDIIVPMARKIERLVNNPSRRPEYLILKVMDFGDFANAYKLYEKEMKNVQPEDTGGSHTKGLSGGQKRRSKDDSLGEPGNRRGAAVRGRRKRPRNKRKKL